MNREEREQYVIHLYKEGRTIRDIAAATDPVIKKQVVNQWLSNDRRDRIADDLMSDLRLNNIKQLGAVNEEQAEQFIARYANSQDPQKPVDVLEKIQ